MRTTVECEAIVFDLDVLATGSTEVGIEAAPGASYLLSHLPADRWSVVTWGTEPVARHRLEVAGLPVPDLLVATEVAPGPADLEAAISALGADSAFSTIVAGCLATLEAATSSAALGAEVVAVASAGEPEHLRRATHVVPSLTSVRVLGQHPVLVLEVDTIPEV